MNFPGYGLQAIHLDWTRGVPTSRSTRIMGGSFRQRLILNSLFRLHSPISFCSKATGKKARKQPPILCILPSDIIWLSNYSTLPNRRKRQTPHINHMSIIPMTHKPYSTTIAGHADVLRFQLHMPLACTYAWRNATFILAI